MPVSQYSVMLSRMWLRVRPPEGWPPEKAREIFSWLSVSWSSIQAASPAGESVKL